MRMRIELDICEMKTLRRNESTTARLSGADARAGWLPRGGREGGASPAPAALGLVAQLVRLRRARQLNLLHHHGPLLLERGVEVLEARRLVLERAHPPEGTVHGIDALDLALGQAVRREAVLLDLRHLGTQRLKLRRLLLVRLAQRCHLTALALGKRVGDVLDRVCGLSADRRVHGAGDGLLHAVLLEPSIDLLSSRHVRRLSTGNAASDEWRRCRRRCARCRALRHGMWRGA